MMNLLFPSANRITRKHYWYSVLAYIAIGIVTSIVFKILAIFIPNQSTEAGTFSVSGAAAIPYLILSFAVLILEIVSSIKVMRRRFHDRDKSGWWILILIVPIIGQLWALIELGFLAGTPGPNRYGPPVGSALRGPDGVGYSTAV